MLLHQLLPRWFDLPSLLHYQLFRVGSCVAAYHHEFWNALPQFGWLSLDFGQASILGALDLTTWQYFQSVFRFGRVRMVFCSACANLSSRLRSIVASLGEPVSPIFLAVKHGGSQLYISLAENFGRLRHPWLVNMAVFFSFHRLLASGKHALLSHDVEDCWDFGIVFDGGIG